jgi:hypothetical protein
MPEASAFSPSIARIGGIHIVADKMPQIAAKVALAMAELCSFVRFVADDLPIAPSIPK